MRVLFVTSAWSAHYYTMVPLAWAFRSAGHEVTVAAAPNMHSTVGRTGLPAVTAGPEMDLPALFRRTIPHTRQERPAGELVDGSGAVFETWETITQAGLDDVVAFARHWRPGLIVCDPLAPAGLVAAQVLGVPGVRHLWSVDVLGSAEGEALIAVLPGFATPFQRYGVTVTGDPAAATIDPYPPSLQPAPGPTRRPVQYVPYNGTGELARDALPARGARPRACLTLGNSTTLAGGAQSFPAATALHALLDAGAEVVVAINPRDRDLLPGELPDHTTVLPSPPLHLLLPHCDLIVHQGGTGSTLTAARYGLAQLMVTSQPETAQNAGSVAAYGAGLHLTAESADQGALATHVDRLVNDENLRHAAGRLQHEVLTQPTPQKVADDLLEICSD